MRKSVPLATAFHLINHGPCPVITTGDGVRRNAAPINWTMPVNDDPPLVATAIEPSDFTHTLIEATGEFIVNVVGEAFGPTLLALGKHSGKTTDKWAAFSLEAATGTKVKAPRLAAAAAHLECRVKDRHRYPGISLFVADVVYAEAEESVFDGRHVILPALRTLHHIGGGYFAVTSDAKKITPAFPDPSL